MTAQLSLGLEPAGQPGFIIDTMVFVGIGRIIYPPELKDSARVIVDELVDDGRVISSIEVYDEVNHGHAKGDGDEVCAIAEAYKHKGVFAKITDEDQENIAEVLSEFPNFVKYQSERPDADPWLVALAMRHSGWTVVSRDGARDTPGLKKMKQVCQYFGITCITDTEFYKMHGWQTSLQ